MIAARCSEPVPLWSFASVAVHALSPGYLPKIAAFAPDGTGGHIAREPAAFFGLAESYPAAAASYYSWADHYTLAGDSQDYDETPAGPAQFSRCGDHG